MTRIALIRRYERASLAYMRDCNTRRIKKQDAKRKRLRDRNEKCFNEMILALHK